MDDRLKEGMKEGRKQITRRSCRRGKITTVLYFVFLQCGGGEGDREESCGPSFLVCGCWMSDYRWEGGWFV